MRSFYATPRRINGLTAMLVGLVIALSPASGRATIEAGPFINPADGHRYYLLGTSAWNDAEAEAVSTLEGHLATINDAAENDWVSNTFSGYSGPFWIGLHFDSGSGNFVWASGQPVTYMNWAAGQPDGVQIPGYYVTMNPQWADDSELSFHYRAVVEVFNGCSLEGTWRAESGETWSLRESEGALSGIGYSNFTIYSILGTRVGTEVTLTAVESGTPIARTAWITASMSRCDSLSATITIVAPPWFLPMVVGVTRIRDTYCGDDNVDPGETCDDGNFIDTDSCNVACNPRPPCGNGTPDPGEDCDDGNGIEKDACLSSCELNSCGDGHVNIGVETCDDGNLTAGDGCAANCTLEPETVTGDISTGLVTTQSGSFYASPSSSDPVETYVSVTLPRTGTVSISEQPAPPNAASGFVLLGALIEVTATNLVPVPSGTDPISVGFRFHASILPAGQDVDSIEVRKDGVVLDNCGSAGVVPPCVAGRFPLRDEIWIQVLTPSLSDFGFSASVCGNAPASGCQPALVRTAKLKLKERGAADQLKWNWKSSRPTSLSIFGDPRGANDYTLCLYDANGRRLQLTAPASGTCAGRPCWRQTATGFKYDDRAGTADGIAKLSLKSGDTGKAKLLMKVRGPGLNLPSLPLAMPVMVQLRSRDGACWESYFPNAKENDASGVNLDQRGPG